MRAGGPSLTGPPRQDPSLARALAEARGELHGEGMDRAGRDIAELIAEGQPVRRIAAAIEAVRRRGASSQGSTP